MGTKGQPAVEQKGIPMPKRIKDLTDGQVTEWKRVMETAGLDADMVVDMTMRPHLAREMIQSHLWRDDARNWVKERLLSLDEDTKVSDMPPGTVGWVSAEIFNKHHLGFGAYAWPQLVAQRTQQTPLRTSGRSSIHGSTPIIRARTGSFWALNTFIAGEVISASQEATDVYVQVVSVVTLAAIVSQLPGSLDDCVVVEQTPQYKVMVVSEPGVSEAQREKSWHLYRYTVGRGWIMCSHESAADTKAFAVAETTNWLNKPAGEYNLPVE